jgi:hypothetical protein
MMYSAPSTTSRSEKKTLNTEKASAFYTGEHLQPSLNVLTYPNQLAPEVLHSDKLSRSLHELETFVKLKRTSLL